MNYWPVSLFLGSPFLTQESKEELLAIGQPGTVLSQKVMVACHQIAAQSPDNGASMVLICNEDAPTRRVYLRQPSNENWLALERGGFVAAHNGFGFVLDALH